MTKYLISFPSEAMVLTQEELPIVAAEAHAVIEEAKAAGVYVFGGGIEAIARSKHPQMPSTFVVGPLPFLPGALGGLIEKGLDATCSSRAASGASVPSNLLRPRPTPT